MSGSTTTSGSRMGDADLTSFLDPGRRATAQPGARTKEGTLEA